VKLVHPLTLIGDPELRDSEAEVKHDLSSDVKLDPIDKRVIADGTGMSCPSSKGFKVSFARTPNVGLIDGREGDQFDRVHFDLTVVHTVPTTRLYLGSPPQPERQRYVTGQYIRSKLRAELHEHNLRQFVGEANRGVSDEWQQAVTVAVPPPLPTIPTCSGCA
jgi:hypothetical protein